MARTIHYFLISLSFVFILLHPLPSSALDTTEPFDIGFSDNEMYFGFGGVGLGRGDKTLGWEHLIGVGITDRFSTMFFYSLESNEFLANRVGDVGIGLFITALDFDMFDLDVMGSVCSRGSFTFATELNLDFSKAGIQLTLEESLKSEEGAHDKVLFCTSLAPLCYFSITESLQLLVSIDFAYFHNGSEKGTIEVGGAGAGANIGLNNTIELITELNFDIPQDEEDFSMGLLVGFVATLSL